VGRVRTTPREWGSLDRDQIVAVALAVAQAEGIEGVTIRRVADAVGASRMALYRHVRDKQELLDLLADEIAWQALPDVDDADDWRDRLRAIAAGLRERLTANPAFIDLMIVRAVHGRGGVAMSELITRAMAATGLPTARVAHFCMVFTDVVLGRIQREAAGDPTRGERNRRLIDAAVASGQAPFVVRHEAELRDVQPDDVFATEVEMVIAEIEKERGDGR
jgi:AcrR family transcriptional regulator